MPAPFNIDDIPGAYPGWLRESAARQEDCGVSFGTNRLTLHRADHTSEDIDYGRIDLAHGGIQGRYLEISWTEGHHNKTIVIRNRGIEDALLKRGHGNRDLQDKLRQLKAVNRRRSARYAGIIIAVLVGIAVLIVALHGAARLMMAAAVERIPYQWEMSLGDQAATQILATTPVCRDEALNRAITRIGRRLARGMVQNPYRWQLHIVDSTDINAFALPGGDVFITRGLLEASSSPEEVAGVMAHEFSHVIHRHGLKNLMAQMGVWVVMVSLTGHMETINQFILSNIAELTTMRFSREQEMEADASALKLISRVNISPNGLLTFMERLRTDGHAASGALTLWSTHPATEDRIYKIREFIAATPVTPIPFDMEWNTLKNRCDEVVE